MAPLPIHPLGRKDRPAHGSTGSNHHREPSPPRTSLPLVLGNPAPGETLSQRASGERRRSGAALLQSLAQSSAQNLGERTRPFGRKRLWLGAGTAPARQHPRRPVLPLSDEIR